MVSYSLSFSRYCLLKMWQLEQVAVLKSRSSSSVIVKVLCKCFFFHGLFAPFDFLKHFFHKFINSIRCSVDLHRFSIFIILRTNHFISVWTISILLVSFSVWFLSLVWQLCIFLVNALKSLKMTNGTACCIWKLLNLMVEPFSGILMACLPLITMQLVLWLFRSSLLPKKLQTIHTKMLPISMFCFVIHKFVQIFYQYMFVFTLYYQ